MIDKLLAFAVVILPTLFALAIEVIDKRIRENTYWRFGVLAFGIGLSGLTWWQQGRAERAANKERENAISETANRVAEKTTKDVTDAFASQYGTTISEMVNQLAIQGKRVEAIGQSGFVNGKNPVPVVVTNPNSVGAGERPLEVHVAMLPMAANPNPQYGKNAMQFMLTTNKVMNGGRVEVTCPKGKINQGSAQIVGSSVMIGSGGGLQDDHTYISGVSTPNWSPDLPLMIILYSDSDGLGACSFRPLQ